MTVEHPPDSTDRKVLLDLFSGLGGFSQAFAEADKWDVVTVEIDPEFSPDVCADIWDLTPSDLAEIIGPWDTLVVLASPPCTQFTLAGNHDSWDHQRQAPRSPEARDAIGLVYHTLGLIRGLDPRYWFLENPRGRLRWVLGQPTGWVSYCQYGHDAMKPTDLWGQHPVMEYKKCQAGADCHETNRPQCDGGLGNTDVLGHKAAERAKVPYELSAAILEAVEGRTEQQTLATVADAAIEEGGR